MKILLLIGCLNKRFACANDTRHGGTLSTYYTSNTLAVISLQTKSFPFLIEIFRTALLSPFI